MIADQAHYIHLGLLLAFFAALTQQVCFFALTNLVPCPFDPAELRKTPPHTNGKRCTSNLQSICNYIKHVQRGRALEHGYRLNLFATNVCVSRYWLCSILHLALYLQGPPSADWWCRSIQVACISLDKVVISKLYTKGLCLNDSALLWSAAPCVICAVAAASAIPTTHHCRFTVSFLSCASSTYFAFVLYLDACSDAKHQGFVEFTVRGALIALVLRVFAHICILWPGSMLLCETIASFLSSLMFVQVERAAYMLGRKTRSFALLPVFDYTSAQNLLVLHGMHSNNQADFPSGYIQQTQQASRLELSAWQKRKQMRVQHTDLRRR